MIIASTKFYIYHYCQVLWKTSMMSWELISNSLPGRKTFEIPVAVPSYGIFRNSALRSADFSEAWNPRSKPQSIQRRINAILYIIQYLLEPIIYYELNSGDPIKYEIYFLHEFIL